LSARIGNTVAEAWSSVLAGKSGIGRITHFDASPLSSQIRRRGKELRRGRVPVAKEARRMDRFIHLGIAAGVQALKDSGLEVTEANCDSHRRSISARASAAADDRRDA